MTPGSLTIDLRGIPEVIWVARKEMAKLLRMEAELEENEEFAQRLRALADVFETGSKP